MAPKERCYGGITVVDSCGLDQIITCGSWKLIKRFLKGVTEQSLLSVSGIP